MAGVDPDTIRELMGHETLAMTMRYPHLAPGIDSTPRNASFSAEDLMSRPGIEPGTL